MVTTGTPRLLAAVFSVSLASASVRVLPWTRMRLRVLPGGEDVSGGFPAAVFSLVDGSVAVGAGAAGGGGVAGCGRHAASWSRRVWMKSVRAWALPGGGMDLTDSLPGAAVREVKEETGLDVEITGLVGTYTDPKHIIAYTDGEVRRQFNVCFTARITGSHQLEISDESTELRFVPPEEIEQLSTHHTQRLRLQHFLDHREKPYLG